MGSKISISLVLFLFMNIILLLSTAVTAFTDISILPTPTTTPPKPKSCPPPPRQSSPHPLNKQSNLPPPPPPKLQSSPAPLKQPNHVPHAMPKSTPPMPTSFPNGKCAKDTLKLGVCANLLGGLVSTSVSTNHHSTPCCTLIKGLPDLDAAVCLCTAIKAHVLHDIHLDIGVSLKVILNTCGKKVPSGFKCAY